MKRAGSEAQFQQRVEQLAAYYGWRHFHAPDNRPGGKAGRLQRVAPGFPDLVLIRPPELIFAELKTDTGRVRSEQAAWIADLEAVAVAMRAFIQHGQDAPRLERFSDAHGIPCIDVYVWRPRDFDAILDRLARGRTVVRPLYAAEGAA
jgi:hypothetical protein